MPDKPVATIPSTYPITRAERAAFVEYPGDAERPIVRGDCDRRQSCPNCGASVHMFISIGANNDRFDRKEIREAVGDSETGEQEERIDDGASLASSLRMRKGEDDCGAESEKGRHEIMRMHEAPARNVRNAGEFSMEFNVATLRQSEGEGISELRRARDTDMRKVEGVQELLCGHGSASISSSLPGQDRQQQGIRTGELQMGDGETATAKQAKLSCPNCGRQVCYHLGVGGDNGHWENYAPGAPAPGLVSDPRDLPYSVLNTCRPCWAVGCKHHLYLDVNPKTGAIKLNFPGLELDQMAETCALDVADGGGRTLADSGGPIGLTKERARQVEETALMRLANAWNNLPKGPLDS